VLNCIDGRTQLPANSWMKQQYGLDYIDTVTQPGIDKVLADGEDEHTQAIREKAEVSVNAHGSDIIAVVGHHDCAANPVDKSDHMQHITQAMETVRSWGLPVRVVGLWIDEAWQVHPVENA